jgi:hypothetical protein
MKHRSKLAWLGALALILAVPPVASSDLTEVFFVKEVKQNKRLNRHSAKLSKHSKQLRRLRARDYGVVRGYFPVDTDRMEAIKGSTLVSGEIPDDGTTRAMASNMVPFDSQGGEELTLRGTILSSRAKGNAVVFIGGGAATGALIAVCAPMGGDTCGTGPETASAGETVCAINHGYNTGTGVLTLVPIKKRYALGSTVAPKASDVNISGAESCKLPAGGGHYNLTISTQWADSYGPDR